MHLSCGPCLAHRLSGPDLGSCRRSVRWCARGRSVSLADGIAAMVPAGAREARGHWRGRRRAGPSPASGPESSSSSSSSSSTSRHAVEPWADRGSAAGIRRRHGAKVSASAGHAVVRDRRIGVHGVIRDRWTGVHGVVRDRRIGVQGIIRVRRPGDHGVGSAGVAAVPATAQRSRERLTRATGARAR